MKSLNNTIIVAFSGGPDSVFLALRMFHEKKYNIILAHFNHQLRGEDSDADEDFCKAFAKKYGMEIETKRWGNPISSEEKARNARYDFLEEVRTKNNAQYIAVAHHQDDDIETILIQFFRGGSIASRSGFEEYDESRKIWRPLLHISKQEILNFLTENNIEYCIDKTNFENIYTRNIFRNTIIPSIKEVFPVFEKNIIEESKRMKEIQEYFQKQANEFLLLYSIEKGIPIEEYLLLPSFIQREVLKKIIQSPFSSLSFFPAFIKFLQKKTSGKRFETKEHVFLCYGEKWFVEKNPIQ